MGEEYSATTCEIGDIAVDIRTETSYEHDRATELMDEGDILEDLMAELGPDEVFLDIGANVGVYSLLAARTGATVAAIEPHPLNLASLDLNIERNDVDVTVIRGALADEARTTELFVASDEAGAGTHTLAHDQVGDETITVDTYTADELIASGKIPSPTIAKLDVQGSEYLVFRGMEDTLANGQLDIIYLELHPEQVEKIGGSVEELTELLEGYGYDIQPLVDKADVTWNVKAVR